MIAIFIAIIITIIAVIIIIVIIIGIIIMSHQNVLRAQKYLCVRPQMYTRTPKSTREWLKVPARGKKYPCAPKNYRVPKSTCACPKLPARAQK